MNFKGKKKNTRNIRKRFVEKQDIIEDKDTPVCLKVYRIKRV
jgi:hypothetical protein